MTLNELTARGVVVSLIGHDRLKASVPPDIATPELRGAILESKPQLIEELKQGHSHRGRYRHVYPGDEAGATELQEIERRVKEEGYVLLRSTLLDDFVAFYKTEADRERIPVWFVPYSDNELQTLFREDDPKWSAERLRRVHMAKRIAGFTFTGVQDE
jgi:hypothetical protein